MQPARAPEFSFPIEIAQIPPGGARYDIAAPEAARAGIAKRLGVVSLERLEASFVVTPMAGGAVRVSGRLGAALVQSCVVSLAPVPATIAIQSHARFMTQAPADAADEVTLDVGSPPEVAPGGRIGLGELAVAQLALVPAREPRADGVGF